MTGGRHDSRDTAGADATERLVTAVDAARLLGVSERTVRRRIAVGALPSVKVGASRLVPVTALTVSPEDDSTDTPDTTVRHDVMVPAVAAATDTAPLVELVERQGREIARLSAELAVANERLRAPAAGGVSRRLHRDRDPSGGTWEVTNVTDQDAPAARQDAPGATEPPRPTDGPWWRRWWRKMAGG